MNLPQRANGVLSDCRHAIPKSFCFSHFLYGRQDGWNGFCKRANHITLTQDCDLWSIYALMINVDLHGNQNRTLQQNLAAAAAAQTSRHSFHSEAVVPFAAIKLTN